MEGERSPDGEFTWEEVRLKIPLCCLTSLIDHFNLKMFLILCGVLICPLFTCNPLGTFVSEYDTKRLYS